MSLKRVGKENTQHNLREERKKEEEKVCSDLLALNPSVSSQ
jgi:hypothetical protein